MNQKYSKSIERENNFNIALKKWKEALGHNKVQNSIEAIEEYGTDTGCSKRNIPAALNPSTVEEVQRAVQIANEHSIRIYPISSGRNWGYGGANPIEDDCVIINCSGLNKIRMLDTETSLVTVEAGVTQEQLKKYLDDKGLNLMIPSTGSGPGCSLLGNVMERGFGITPYSDHFKATTTLEAVLTDGSLYQSAMMEMGGEEADKVFKWGIGPYIDGMFTQGSFGIVTAITFALHPVPQCSELFFFKATNSNLDKAMESVRDMLRKFPGIIIAVNVMNQYRLVSTLGDLPEHLIEDDSPLSKEIVAELAKKHHLPEWMAMGAIYCPKSIVRKVRREIRKSLSPIKALPLFLNDKRITFLSAGAKLIPGKIGKSLREYMDTVSLSLDIIKGQPSEVAIPMCYWRSGEKPKDGKNFHPANDGCGLMWYMALVPLKVETVKLYSEMVERVCLKNGLEPFLTLTVISEQCIESTVPLLFDKNNSKAHDMARKCYDELFHEGKKIGVMPNRLSIDQMSYFENGAPKTTALIQKIQNALDPKRIMMPGRYGA